MQAHCPVVGVCIPVDRLRQLVSKLVGPVLADDYAVHVGVVTECRQRSPISARIQKELDQRYALAVREANRHKCAEALAEGWRARAQGPDVAGLLWATLTHPRCGAALEERVLHDVHMLQHQVGASRRFDLERHDALLREHRALVSQLAEAQQRTSRVLAEKAARLERQKLELLRLRAEAVRRQAVIDRLRGELDAAPRSTADERRRARTRPAVFRAPPAPVRPTPPAREPTGSPSSGPQEPPTHRPAGSLEDLRDKSILCVGGRAASVPAYRRLVERTGGRFHHHDGGSEDSVTQLDACLASADLVICQTGCISHNAYWRVKDHCKRTGKQCLFVDNPSTSSLARGLLGTAVDRPSPARSLRGRSPLVDGAPR